MTFAPRPLVFRHLSEQYLTSFQTFAQARRQVNGRPHATQMRSGNSDFLRIFAIASDVRQERTSGFPGPGFTRATGYTRPMPANLSDVAVVLAAHGDRGGAAPNSTLRSHRDRLQAMGVFRTVTAGVLNGEPSLESALLATQAAGAQRIAVYPMFMAAGYFTNMVLPERIAAVGLDRQCRILEPLGQDLRIPSLLLDEARAAAAAAGLEPAATRLLIVGHGSKLGPASANATREVASAVARLQSFMSVETAFLEELPFVDAALAGERPPTVVSGFFSGDGLHAQEDVPEAIAEAGGRAVYAGSIGRSAELASIIRDAVEMAMARN